MKFDQKLIQASFIKRYKRFFVDVKLAENNEIVTAHCANTGKMLGLCNEDSLVYIAPKTNPKAKLKYGLEIIEDNNALVGINTMKPNHIVREAVIEKKIAPLQDFSFFKNEVKYGTNSKIDLLLKNENGDDLYLEVKNVHLIRESNLAEFPDTATERGAKHLEELTKLAENNIKAVNLFLVQREDCTKFKIAKDLDENYYNKALIAKKAGVLFLAYNCTVNPYEIKLKDQLEIIW